MTTENDSQPSQEMPPVPAGLQEMLKDYPEYIEQLQDGLNRLMENPRSYPPLFEQAIWRIEDVLDRLINESREELEKARSFGDINAIKDAQEKENLILEASWKHVWIGDDLLWNFFHRFGKGGSQ